MAQKIQWLLDTHQTPFRLRWMLDMITAFVNKRQLGAILARRGVKAH